MSLLHEFQSIKNNVSTAIQNGKYHTTATICHPNRDILIEKLEKDGFAITISLQHHNSITLSWETPLENTPAAIIKKKTDPYYETVERKRKAKLDLEINQLKEATWF